MNDKLDIRYGILAVDSRLDVDGMNPILHFCGYEDPPNDDDFDDLRHELATDKEFGLTEMMDYVILVQASEEVVEMYRKIYE